MNFNSLQEVYREVRESGTAFLKGTLKYPYYTLRLFFFPFSGLREGWEEINEDTKNYEHHQKVAYTTGGISSVLITMYAITYASLKVQEHLHYILIPYSMSALYELSNIKENKESWKELFKELLTIYKS